LGGGVFFFFFFFLGSNGFIQLLIQKREGIYISVDYLGEK